MKGHLYWTTAVRILRSLCENYLARINSNGWEGILKGGVYHVHKELGVNESVMWGEYFFVEALDQALRQMQHKRRTAGDKSVRPFRTRSNRYCDSGVCGCRGVVVPEVSDDFVPITSPETTSSTRRFCCRPAAVSLDATGVDLAEALAPSECPTAGPGSTGNRARHRRAVRTASDCNRRCRRCPCGLQLRSSGRDERGQCPHAGELLACERTQACTSPCRTARRTCSRSDPRAVSRVSRIMLNCCSSCCRSRSLSCSAVNARSLRLALQLDVPPRPALRATAAASTLPDVPRQPLPWPFRQQDAPLEQRCELLRRPGDLRRPAPGAALLASRSLPPAPVAAASNCCCCCAVLQPSLLSAFAFSLPHAPPLRDAHSRDVPAPGAPGDQTGILGGLDRFASDHRSSAFPAFASCSLPPASAAALLSRTNRRRTCQRQSSARSARRCELPKDIDGVLLGSGGIASQAD